MPADTLKAVSVIRKSIVAHTLEADDLLRGKIEMDESYFGPSLARLVAKLG